MHTLRLVAAAVLALTVLALGAGAEPESSGPGLKKAEPSPAARTLLWRFRNQTKTDLQVWVRLLDVPWSQASSLSDDGRMNIEAGKMGSLNATLSPKFAARSTAPQGPMTGKALIVMMPDGKEAGSQWLIHEFSVDDRPTIEPLLIDEELFSHRRDVLFVKNESTHPIRLSMPTIQVPSEKAKEGRDFVLRTTGDIGSDSIVIRPGASAPWLILTQTGAVGGGARLVECSLRTDGFAGRCALDWKSYVTGVIRFDDAAIAKLDADAKALAADVARREAEADSARQIAAEQAAEAAQARRVAAEQRRQQAVRAQQQQGDLLAAGAILLGLLLVGEMMGNDGWGGGWGGGGDEDGVCPSCSGSGVFYEDASYTDGEGTYHPRREGVACRGCGGSGRRR